MAILMRGGGYLDFDPTKLRPREWAVVLQDDPSSRDGKAVYICFAAGNVKRISTYEDMKDDLISATDDVIEQYVQAFNEIKTEVERLKTETLGYKNTVQEKATEAVSSAQTASEKSQSASASATNSANSADLSEEYSLRSKSYAVGTDGDVRPNDGTDNSKYYKEECQRLYQNIEQLISSVTTGGLIPAGTVSFADLPLVPNLGYMYNISDDFVTDERFEEGAGKYYSSGTNAYWTANAKWDVLTGVAVLGVKGESEALYQTGYVNITKESIGLDKVENMTPREILEGLTATDVTDALGYIPGSEDGGVTGVKGENETEYRKGNVNLTKGDIGLDSVENKSSEDIRAEITAENIENALGYVPGNGSGNVTGVKGEAEETYRNGNVNVSKADIGLGDVDNTADTEKPVSLAQQAELDKKANKTDIVQNSRTNDGYVMKGEGYPNKVWGTDENGNPGWMDMPKGGGRTLSDCEDISAESATNGVNLMWTDPQNLVFNDEVVAQWAGTKVVRKEGGKPKSVDDGVLVADSTVKDAHKTSPLVDTGAKTNGMEYNYLLCPYTTDGAVTESDFSRVAVLFKSTDPIMNNNSWEVINDAVQNGTAKSIWFPTASTVQYKDVYIEGNINSTIRFIAVGWDKENLSNGGNNSITFRSQVNIDDYHGLDGKKSTDFFPMESYCGKYYNWLPDEVQRHVKTVKKRLFKYSSTSATGTPTISTDIDCKTFVFSCYEISGKQAIDGCMKMYDYYSVRNTDEDRKVSLNTDLSNYYGWVLCSSISGTQTNLTRVVTRTGASSYSSNISDTTSSSAVMRYYPYIAFAV